MKRLRAALLALPLVLLLAALAAVALAWPRPRFVPAA